MSYNKKYYILDIYIFYGRSKELKRIICILLSIALVSLAFTACAKKEQTGSEQSGYALKFTVDSHYSDFDESTVKTYERLCNAIIERKPDFRFNTTMLDDVNTLIYTSFPLHTLIKEFKAFEDNTGISISYNFEAEEHAQKVQDFSKAVKEIEKACGYGKVDNNTYLINVYTYFAQNFAPNNSYYTLIDTAITKNGISATVTGLFEFVLLQAGIKAYHIICTNPELIGKAMSMVELNGKLYVFDVFKEHRSNGGKGLTCFAMCGERAGMSKKNVYTYTNGDELEVPENEEFAQLAEAVSFTYDNGTIKAVTADGDEVTVKLN